MAFKKILIFSIFLSFFLGTFIHQMLNSLVSLCILSSICPPLTFIQVSGKCSQYDLSKLSLNFKIYLFIFGCTGSSQVPGLFSSCGEQGLLLIGSRTLGHLDFSSCSSWVPEHSFSSWGAWAISLKHVGSSWTRN